MPHDLLHPVLDAARKAGARIMADWRQGKPVTRKTDGSPVTETDQAAEDIVVAALRAVSPHTIVAEEAAHKETPFVDTDAPFWLVDALDGTRDFIHGGHDFTVNIALIEAGEPVFGVIHAPAFDVSWYAVATRGAYRVQDEQTTPIKMRPTPPEGYHLLSGVRSAEPVVLTPFLGEHRVAGRDQRSSSLKFCLVAEGQYDLYPRLGQTYEWDTAAGDIILREAGGVILDLRHHEPIQYGKMDRRFENEGFIAGSRSALKIAVL
jgi:3'(2'), 5'-bisphosphate nucleotidase